MRERVPLVELMERDTQREYLWWSLWRESERESTSGGAYGERERERERVPLVELMEREREGERVPLVELMERQTDRQTEKDRMYLWWSLCTLYLFACQVKVTAGDSDLCCVCLTSFER